MKKILLLGSGELGKEFVIAAKRAGAYVVACDRYNDAPAMQVADEREVFSMLDGDALAAVLSAYPVGIRQIDANGGGWIFVATKHGCTYDIGRHTLDYRLAESWIDR